MNLGAHQRPIDQIKAQHVEPCVVAARFQIRIEKPGCEIRTAAIHQVHHQKRNLAHDIDPAQRRIELDAVERRERALKHHNIAQMQIAVAFAYVTFHLALTEQGLARVVFVFGPISQWGDARLIRRVRQQIVERREIIACRRDHHLGGSVRTAACRDAGTGMKCGDARCQRIEVRAGENALCKQAAGQRVLRKFAHFDCVFKGRCVAGNVRIATAHVWTARAAGDFHHGYIKRRRQPAIQAQLLLATTAPRFERAEIEKTQVDRLLDLVGVLPRQYYP